MGNEPSLVLSPIHIHLQRTLTSSTDLAYPHRQCAPTDLGLHRSRNSPHFVLRFLQS